MENQQFGASAEESEGKKKKKKKKNPKTGASRSRTSLILAVVLAVLSLGAVLTLGGESDTDVWVLRSKVRINQLEQVQEGMLEAVKLPAEAIEPTSITADSSDEILVIAVGDATSEKVVGAFPLFPIREGQQLSFEMFTSTGSTATALLPGERLVSVESSTGTAIAGSLRPGDRVDVVSVNSQDDTAGLVAVDVEIVSVQVNGGALDSASQRQASESGQDLSREDVLPRDPIPGTYVLKADAETSVALTIADSSGPLYLLYRSPNAENVAVGVVDLATVICNAGLELDAGVVDCSIAALVQENASVVESVTATTTTDS
jgi:Flp pilus assembly protein CpaB